MTVEWFEHGETKGKELPVDQILSLNPDLCPEPYYPNVASNSNSVAGINRMKLVRIWSFMFLFFYCRNYYVYNL